jgi:hypothetical protein
MVETVERLVDRPLPDARDRIGRRVIAAAREARSSYRAEPWPGPVALITSDEFADRPTFVAWEERAIGGVERREVAFDHLEMLRGAGAAALAETVEELISSALSPSA